MCCFLAKPGPTAPASSASAGGGAAAILRAVLKPRDETHELLHRLLVGLATLLGHRQLGVAEHTGCAEAAGPRHEGRGPGREKIETVDRAFLGVEADKAPIHRCG